MVLGGMYRGPEGAPVGRISAKLSGVGKSIYRVLELGVWNPVGARDWLLGGAGGVGGWVYLGTLGRRLTSPEVRIYFKGCIVLRPRKLSWAIVDNRLS